MGRTGSIPEAVQRQVLLTKMEIKMNKELMEVIENERWPETSCSYDLDGHNEAINRIAEAAQKPRVMKVWSKDCKPEKDDVAWLKIVYHRVVDLYFISKSIQEKGIIRGEKITHWLELEPTPILP